MSLEAQEPTADEKANAKFERRGFAPAPPAEEADPAEELQEPMAEAELNLELEAEAAEAAAPEPAEPEEEISIGGKTFKNQTEALNYAEELEREKIAADAFRQGLELGQQAPAGNKTQTAAQPAASQQVPPEFYTDPAGYLAKREAEMAQRLKNEVNAERTQEQKSRDTWAKFYSENPDLEQYDKRFVKPILNENWNVLQGIETDKALKILASKVREEIGPMAKAAAPGRELASIKQATTTGKGAPVTKQKAPAEKEPLNFVNQMRSIKAKRAGSSVK